MLSTDSPDPSIAARSFPFRPWVGRAGASIVGVAAVTTAGIVAAVLWNPSLRFGWFREPFVWVYIGALWFGGLRILLGARQPIAEASGEEVLLRPLHQMFARKFPWSAVRGTEQMIGGDRLILYYEGERGLRFVALNLNLIKGRRQFVELIDERLMALGFVEKIAGRSRYLARPSSPLQFKHS